jgi:hypothetical protein
MAALPDSISKDSKGKSTYNPKCVSGILNGECWV